MQARYLCLQPTKKSVIQGHNLMSECAQARVSSLTTHAPEWNKELGNSRTQLNGYVCTSMRVFLNASRDRMQKTVYCRHFMSEVELLLLRSCVKLRLVVHILLWLLRKKIILEKNFTRFFRLQWFTEKVHLVKWFPMFEKLEFFENHFSV